MKRTTVGAILVGVFLGYTLGSSGASAFDPPPTWRIWARPLDGSIELMCAYGCRWRTATYTCGKPGSRCVFGVDEHGVGGPMAPDFEIER